jgi:hypothetical protein
MRWLYGACPAYPDTCSEARIVLENDDAAVDPAVGGAVLGDVGEPDPIGRVRSELALNQVLVSGRVGLPAPVFALLADTLKAGLPHQPRHPLTTTRHAQTEPQLGMHPRRPIGSPGLVVHAGDGHAQSGVLDRAG